MKGHLKLERRHAFGPVIYGKGFSVGRAEEGVPGFTPTRPYCATYKEAQDHADALNKQLGLTPKEAWEIVASTMGRPRETVQEPAHFHENSISSEGQNKN
ncbi:MAG: hypothetical protein IMZ64_08655 [Bacteroidetes bacterium]|nr:hypothetical protein [Bacteroidota bacterium]